MDTNEDHFKDLKSEEIKFIKYLAKLTADKIIKESRENKGQSKVVEKESKK